MFVGSFCLSFVRRDTVLNIFRNRNIYSVVTFFYVPFFFPFYFLPICLLLSAFYFWFRLFLACFFVSFFLPLFTFFSASFFSYPLRISSSFSLQNISRLMMFMKQSLLTLKTNTYLPCGRSMYYCPGVTYIYHCKAKMCLR